MHVEPSFSPGDYARHGLETAGLIEAVLRGAERAARATGIGIGLVLDLVRDDGPAAAARCLAEAVPYRDQGVVAVGLGGSEARFLAGPLRRRRRGGGPAGLPADGSRRRGRRARVDPGDPRRPRGRADRPRDPGGRGPGASRPAGLASRCRSRFARPRTCAPVSWRGTPITRCPGSSRQGCASSSTPTIRHSSGRASSTTTGCVSRRSGSRWPAWLAWPSTRRGRPSSPRRPAPGSSSACAALGPRWPRTRSAAARGARSRRPARRRSRPAGLSPRRRAGPRSEGRPGAPLPRSHTAR